MKNIYKKVKRNSHKTPSTASVDKSVHKFAPPSKYRIFLHGKKVFAYKLSID